MEEKSRSTSEEFDETYFDRDGGEDLLDLEGTESLRRRSGSGPQSMESESDPRRKRKAQNRAAQKAFRERKQQHVKQLEESIKEIVEQHAQAMQQLQGELQSLRSLVQTLETENHLLKSANFLHSHGSSEIWSSSSTVNMVNSFITGMSMDIDIDPEISLKTISNTKLIPQKNHSRPGGNEQISIDTQAATRESDRFNVSFLGANNPDYGFINAGGLDDRFQSMVLASSKTPNSTDSIAFTQIPNSQKESQSSRQDSDQKRANWIVLWTRLTEHPQFDEFDISQLSRDLKQNLAELVSETGEINEEKFNKFLEKYSRQS